MNFTRDLLEQFSYKKKNKNVSSIALLLHNIVDDESSEIFNNPAKFQKVLREADISEFTIYQLCLMTKVSGFSMLTQTDASTKQADLNRYVQNAIEETGLSKAVVLDLTADIAYSLDIATLCDTKEKIEEVYQTEKAFVIPYSIYEKELKNYQESLRILGYSGISNGRLEALCAAGLPKAKYYMACGILKENGDSEKGLSLLREAAQEGDAEAAALLGDYYYEKQDAESLEKAYQYYTSYGALALNTKRRKSLTGILNQKKYNRKIRDFSIMFAALLAILVMFLGKLSLYEVHPIWSAGCIIAEVLLAVYTVIIYVKRPYKDLYSMPIAMFGMWCVFVAMKLLF